MMKILGEGCVVCGYSDTRALQIDLKKGIISNEYERYGRGFLFYYLEHPILAEQNLETICANCKRIKNFEKKHTLFVN